MSVTCLRKDQEHFKQLGFHVEFDEDKSSPIIEMVDEEANYGHYEEMPTHLVYYGSYGAGSNYGSGSLVCDGVDFEDVPTHEDGFVLAWDYRLGLPRLKGILRIRRFIKLERRVIKLLKELRERPETMPKLAS